MSSYITSESISTMQGLQIPILDIREYANSVSEVSTGDIFTQGNKSLTIPAKTIKCEIKSGTWGKLDAEGVAVIKSDDNIITTRLTLSGNVVRYMCFFQGDGIAFCDVNEKLYPNINYSKYAFIPPVRVDRDDKIVFLYYDSNDGIRYYRPFTWTNKETYFYTERLTFYDIDKIGDFTIYEKSDEYGDYSSGGGYGGGSFDDSSDAFGLPSLPSLGVSEAGFVNVYKATAGQLVGFADELFPDFEMPTPSTKEGIDGVVENLNNVASVLGFFADSYLNKGLIDYVIDCHIVPVSPTITTNTGIKVGYKTFNYNPSKVTSDYVEVDCGSLQIAEYYQNFLDYEGTRAKLYAPFIGFVDIKPEWFQSGSLRLVYHFNIIDGSCIAFVIATSSKSQLKNTVVATFGGNCCVHMPITGLNYSSMISGILGGANKVVNGIQGGSVPQMVNGVEQAVLARPTLEQSNGYNAGMSFMCYRRPYLLIERPVASFSKNYPKEQGLPLNVTKKLGTMKGFTTCTAPIVDNFHCLEEEKEMIKQALIEGTIF